MERLSIVFTRLSRRGSGRKQGFMQLFISKRLIHGLASSMAALFVPIFLYEVSGEQVAVVTGFYIVIGLLYILLLVPGMKFTNRIGFSRALGVAMLFSILYFLGLFFMNSGNYWWVIAPTAIALALFRLLHWVPYHVNFAVLTSAGERGKSVSLMFAAIAFMSMIGPLLAGVIISSYGYEALFGLSMILFGLAGLSYLLVPPADERFTWTFIETVQQLFSPAFRGTAYLELAYGAEAVLHLVAWPLFIYTLLNGNVLEIGGVTALIVLVTILLELFVGRYLDKGKDNALQTLKRGGLFHAFGWILKMFALTSMHIFFVGLYHNITRIFVRTPYNTMLYDASGEQGHYVDEFTVLREMAHHTGRIIGLFLITALAILVSIEVTFVIGVVATLLMTVVYKLNT